MHTIHFIAYFSSSSLPVRLQIWTKVQRNWPELCNFPQQQTWCMWWDLCIDSLTTNEGTPLACNPISCVGNNGFRILAYSILDSILTSHKPCSSANGTLCACIQASKPVVGAPCEPHLSERSCCLNLKMDASRYLPWGQQLQGEKNGKEGLQNSLHLGSCGTLQNLDATLVPTGKAILWCTTERT